MYVFPDTLVVISTCCSTELIFCMLCAAGLLSPLKGELLLRLQSEIENVTDAWLSTALKSLLLIQSRSEHRSSFQIEILKATLSGPMSKVCPRFG